jgi:hypothetical protein
MRLWRSLLCIRPTRLEGFCIVLGHWNNSPRIDMSPYLDTLSWFQANKILIFFPYCCLLVREAINTHCIVFGLTRSGLEPTIYRTRDEHANHYTTDAVPTFNAISTRYVWFVLSLVWIHRQLIWMSWYITWIWLACKTTITLFMKIILTFHH